MCMYGPFFQRGFIIFKDFEDDYDYQDLNESL